MINNTTLQVINFNFYGDELITLKDNVAGKIYTSINSVLRGIGFTDKVQIRKRRDKWINDIVISKGVMKFNIPTQEVVTKNVTTLFDGKDTYCISQHKLPLALAKINITLKMKQNQPELASKLEPYQDKCADVLAPVFIDHKTTDQVTMQPLLDTLNTFIKTVNNALLSLNERMSKLEESQEQVKKSLPKKRFSYWNSKMFPKYQLLMDYFGIDKNNDLYKQLYKEFYNTYPDIEINQVVDDEIMVDGLLEKYDLISENVTVREKTIFDN